jgi:hypothetical protein
MKEVNFWENPLKLSQILKNSIYNTKEILKSNRLDWENYSLKEAETWLTATWHKSERRIIIWLSDDKSLILIDWTHLLEGYRQLQKPIPEKVIDFMNIEAKNKLMQYF